MRERVTANLPARSLDETAAFYDALGFAVAFRDQGWLILRRGELEIEFFPHPGLDPWTSWFSACVRVADADRLRAEWGGAGLPSDGIPRMTTVADEPSGWRSFALVDPNGSLLRCLSPAPRASRPDGGTATA
jgi:catechol 2,3-dioxygenase-like lactoylglutathione lyase family enzyme